jgi:MATE family multidrug resistance protein
VDIAGFSVFVFVIGSLGARELAATSLAFNLNTLAFVPLIGIGIAVMTLVGNRVGEGRPELAVKTTWTAFTLSAVWMIGFAIVYLCFPDTILAPYKASGNTSAEEFAAIRETVIVLLQFVSAYCFFDAMLVIFSNAVRGAGDTRFPMLITFVCCWFVMVLPTWVYTNSIDDLTDSVQRTRRSGLGGRPARLTFHCPESQSCSGSLVASGKTCR